MSEKKQALYQRLSEGFTLAMLMLGAIAAMNWLGEIVLFGKVSLTQVAAGLATLAGIAAKFYEKKLPARSGPLAVPTVVLFGLLALLMVLPGCKVPYTATMYRSYSVAHRMRDSAGELITLEQQRKAKVCEDAYKPGEKGARAKLVECLKKVREPVHLWVNTLKPALRVALASFFAVVETVYASKKSDIDKTAKAVLIACADLEAVVVGLETYKEKLGKYASMLLGPVAALKVLVCQ